MSSERRGMQSWIGHRHLVDKLLHLLHGVVSLQQRRHSHEAFVTAPAILFLLLLFPVILFVYSRVLWDVLTRWEKQTLLRTRGSGGPILQSGVWTLVSSAEGDRRPTQVNYKMFFCFPRTWRDFEDTAFILDALLFVRRLEARKLSLSRAARRWQPA